MKEGTEEGMREKPGEMREERRRDEGGTRKVKEERRGLSDERRKGKRGVGGRKGVPAKERFVEVCILGREKS